MVLSLAVALAAVAVLVPGLPARSDAAPSPALSSSALSSSALSWLSPASPAPASPAEAGGGLSPEVAALPAHSVELDGAVSALDRAVATRARDQQELDDVEAALALTTEADRATTSLTLRRAGLLTKVDSALAARRSALRGLAAEWYASGTADQRSFDPALAPDELEELRRQAVLGAAAARTSTDAIRFLDRRGEGLREELEQLRRTSDRLSGRLAEQTERVARLRVAVDEDSAAVARAEAVVAAARMTAIVDGTDIPTVSLDAYWRAARAMSLLRPECGIAWWALAGIGRTESRHGTYLGSVPAPGGRVEPPILGPPLDGTNGFRKVPDSDGGALDGDSVSDRAVGPMQFLPSTWRAVGRDGNGDGTSDPDNIYDAALGAATYLCRGGAVADEVGMRRAYFSYNRSLSYVDTVTGLAFGYRDAVALPSLIP